MAYIIKTILNIHQALSSYQGMILLHGVRSQKVKVAIVNQVKEDN